MSKSFVCAEKGIHRRKRRHQSTKQEIVAKYSYQLKAKPTYAESVFREKLDCTDLEYVFQYPIYYKGFMAIIDFYITGHRVGIEVDGGYHNNPDQQHKDSVKAFILQRMGIETLRFTNQEAQEMSFEQIYERIGIAIEKTRYQKKQNQHLRHKKHKHKKKKKPFNSQLYDVQRLDYQNMSHLKSIITPNT